MIQPEVKKLLQLLRLFKQVEKSPQKGGSFSSVLGLDYHQLEPEQVEFNAKEKIITIRDVELSNATPMLASHLAMVDEITTMALLLTDTRPGVSLSLRAARTTASTRETEKETSTSIDVVSKVDRLGRNISFTSAQVFDSVRGTLLSDASHVKYMPMPSRVAEFALSPRGWPLTQLYSNHVLEDIEKNETLQSSSLDNMLDSYQYHPEDGTASFASSSSYNNGFGTLHGGAQAILMEHTIREKLSREQQHEGGYQVDSLSVEYLTTPKSQTVQIEAEPLFDESSDGRRKAFTTKMKSKGKLNSIGHVSLSKV